MITAAIVDDEIKSILILKRMLADCCHEIEVVAEAKSIEEGCLVINDKRPALVFLDIQMTDGTGFDLLEQFDSPFFYVIFITAHSEYAVKAFKFSAVDYLLKPIDVDDLVSAVKKASKIIALNRTEDQSHIPYLSIRTTKGILRIKPEDIIRIHAEGSYSRLYLSDGKNYLFTNNLGTLHETLNGSFFLRIHKSVVININYLKTYIGADQNFVEMLDGSSIPVSRRNKAILLKRLNAD